MNTQKPFSTASIIRLQVVALIIITFVAGYYHSALVQERKNYRQLQKKYDTLSEQGKTLEQPAVVNEQTNDIQDEW